MIKKKPSSVFKDRATPKWKSTTLWPSTVPLPLQTVAEWRYPPPLDKRAVREESNTLCREEETVIHGENGVVDEEEWDEGAEKR